MGNQITRLDDRLSELNLSFADLARMVAETPQAVNNWRKRGRIPGAKLSKVAAALFVTTDWLLSGETEKSSDFLGNITDKKDIQNLEKIIEYYLQSNNDGKALIISTAQYASGALKTTKKPFSRREGGARRIRAKQTKAG